MRAVFLIVIVISYDFWTNEETTQIVDISIIITGIMAKLVLITKYSVSKAQRANMRPQVISWQKR